jgi:preprotein translocase subunit SecA
MNWIAKLIGNNYNESHINKIKPLVAQINQFDEQWMSLTDAEIKAKT